MQAPLFEPDSSLVKRALAACEFRKSLWAADLTRRNSADDLLQSGEALTSLFNDLFWSSMQVEEGRQVVGAICICSPVEAPRSRKLATPVAVCPEALIQLFVASPKNLLAIDLLDEKPCIWGFLDARPMFTITVKVAGVGTLVLSEDDAVIGVLQAGRISLPNSISKTSWMLLLAGALGTAPFPERLMLAVRFQSVAFAMHAQRHGGALVILPPVKPGEDLQDISLKYLFDSNAVNIIRSTVDELKSASDNLTIASDNVSQGLGSVQLKSLFHSSVEAHRGMLDAISESVGCLSRIDGAVIMDTELRVHGFGAKLAGAPGSFPVFTFDSITSAIEDSTVSSLGGMRHQSAARFVQSNPEAIVIVASQDGRLTLFAWVTDKARVVAVRGLEHYTWSGTSAA